MRGIGRWVRSEQEEGGECDENTAKTRGLDALRSETPQRRIATQALHLGARRVHMSSYTRRGLGAAHWTRVDEYRKYAHVKQDDPGKRDRQLPFFALHRSLDMSGREVVGHVNVQLDVLAIFRIVHHIQHKTMANIR